MREVELGHLPLTLNVSDQLPDGFKIDRVVSEPTCRVGIDDKHKQRYVMVDVDWEMPTERVVERKEKDSDVYHVKLEKVSRKYNPKVG